MEEEEQNIFESLELNQEGILSQNFLNLNLKSRKNKNSHKYGDYQTDRVFIESNENSKLNRSL